MAPALLLARTHAAPPWIPFIVPGALLLLIIGLWIMYFFPRGVLLRARGMELARNGNPAEAVKCYHQCLARGSKVPIAEQIRLQVCLGDALMDLGRYAESERSLSRALTLGDRTGSCHSSRCFCSRKPNRRKRSRWWKGPWNSRQAALRAIFPTTGAIV